MIAPIFYPLRATSAVLRPWASLGMRQAAWLITRQAVPLLVVWLCASLLATSAGAQSQDLRIFTRADSTTYVYHGQLLPVGYGFNVYRSTNGSDFVRINDETVYPVQQAGDVPSILGPVYETVQDALDAQSPAHVLMRLRSRRDVRLLLAFTYPEVADMLGMLYVDAAAPVGDRATYRFEIVNDVGAPSGTILEDTALLTPRRPAPPENVQVTNEDRRVRLSWTYPPANVDDGVIRFDVYYRTNGAFHRVREMSLLRTGGESYERVFDVPSVGSVYTFRVEAVDITGQRRAAPVLRTRIEDTMPPEAPSDVATNVRPGGVVEISWPVSPEPDAAGYHVYRAPRSMGPWTRMNHTVLGLMETVFADSTTTPGTLYQYSVAAVDSSGNESRRSRPTGALVEDHEPPSGVSSLEGRFEKGRGVVLVWQNENPAPDINTYVVVRRRTDRNGRYSQINRTRVREMTYTEAGAAGKEFAPGATYAYGVAVADSATNFSDTAFVEIRIPDDSPPPAPGTVRVANEDGRRVNVTWTTSPTRDLATFRVYRAAVDETQELLAEGTRRLFRDDTVQPGTAYVYAVASVDSLGNESRPTRSDTLLVRDGSPPRAVRNVQAEAAPGGVHLAWEPVPGDDLRAYVILRAEIPTGHFQPVMEVPRGTTAWIDPDGVAGLWYRIRAVDVSENVSRSSSRVQAVERSSASRPDR